MTNDILFEVVTPLGFSVRVTRAYWELIVTVKHPVMRGREADVQVYYRYPNRFGEAVAIPPFSSFIV
jgi:hypothetical protein